MITSYVQVCDVHFTRPHSNQIPSSVIREKFFTKQLLFYINVTITKHKSLSFWGSLYKCVSPIVTSACHYYTSKKHERKNLTVTALYWVVSIWGQCWKREQLILKMVVLPGVSSSVVANGSQDITYCVPVATPASVLNKVQMFQEHSVQVHIIPVQKAVQESQIQVWVQVLWNCTTSTCTTSVSISNVNINDWCF